MGRKKYNAQKPNGDLIHVDPINHDVIIIKTSSTQYQIPQKENKKKMGKIISLLSNKKQT